MRVPATHPLRLAVLVAACFWTSATVLEAQDLSGTWLRGKAKLRLVEVVPNVAPDFVDTSGKPKRRSITKRFWIRIDGATPSGYEFALFDDHPNGLVLYSRNNPLQLSGAVVEGLPLTLPVDLELGDESDARHYLQGSLNGRFLVGLDANGDVASGTLVSTGFDGCITRLDPSAPDSTAFVVDSKIKLSVVAADTVPPTVLPFPSLSTNRQSFLSFSFASKASANNPSGLQPGATYTSGEVTFVAAFPSTLNFSNWPADFQGDNDVELALNGDENLTIISNNKVFAMGIDIDDVAGGSGPSTFFVSARDGETEIVTFQINLPIGGVTFFGVTSAAPFDRLVITETTRANENEYFGLVFTNREPTLVP